MPPVFLVRYVRRLRLLALWSVGDVPESSKRSGKSAGPTAAAHAAAESCSTRPRAACARHTKRRNNAHKIEELEVLYPWHPWFGRVVHVHEVIEQRAGGVLHCSPDGDASRRWLEVLSGCSTAPPASRSAWRPYRVSILRRSEP